MKRWRRYKKLALNELKRFKLFDLDDKLIENKDHELWEQIFLQKYIQPSDSVLQLGANIGTSCILVDKCLDNRGLNVCVEPVREVFDVLVRNKEYNKCDFVPVFGVVSKDSNLKIKTVGINGAESFVSVDGDSEVNSYTLTDMENLISSKFSVLFADCEGCFNQFLYDFPEIFDNLRLIIVEKDRLGETEYSDQLIESNGFVKKISHALDYYNAPIYEVWQK